MGRDDLKDSIKAVRSKATGVKPHTGPSGIRPKTAPVKAPAARKELVYDEAPTEEPEVLDLVPSEADKIKTKINAYVTKHFDAERNRRLRSNEGQMNRKQITALKKKLKREAALKFDPESLTKTGKSNLPETPVRGASDDDPRREYTPSVGSSQTRPAYNDDQCESAHLTNGPIRFDLNGARSAPVGTSTPNRASAIPSETMYNFDDQQRHHHQQRPQEGDAWWTDEESKWKAELDARRETDELSAAPAPGSPTDSGTAEEDICLRTQLVVKRPEDTGLGVQLYTPKNQHGVRLTKIVPDGPFGRTNAFEEGDVIVEINGVPLLYAGHAAVFETVRGEMLNYSEMTVTVCSPVELLKLEALVRSDSTPDTSTGNKLRLTAANLWNAAVPKKWVDAIGSIGNIFSAKRDSNGNVGTLRGAPSWWKEGSSKRKSRVNQSDTAQQSSTMTDQGEATASAEPDTERAYLIYRADIRDLEAYKAEYMSTTSRLISKFGGKWLARGGKITQLEGGEPNDMVLQRMVLIEFPSMEHAANFFHSEEYQEARLQRLSIATAELTVLEGMTPM